MRRRSPILAQAGVFLALAAACALISNATAGSARRLGWTGRPAAAAPASGAAPSPPSPAGPVDTARFAADPNRPIRDISPQEAWGLYQAKAPFLDARRSGAYAEGHIPGAWNISIWEAELDTRITAFEAAARPGSTRPLVLYCEGGGCEDSKLLAGRLTPLGYRNLLVYRAGYPDWVKQGRPTRKGARP